MKLPDNAAIDFAKELTLAAIENGIIVKTTDNSKNARAIAEFYETICDELVEEV